MPLQPRAWEIVLRHIERELLDGKLRPGDHLPPERALATELGVGRSSVREAVRVLEGFGLIRTQTGSGPSAGAIIIATPQGGMSALMRLQVAAQGFPVADIVQTRLLLETQIVAGLADAGSPLDPVSLGAAERLLAAMDVDTLTPAEFLALDAQFHVALAEASGNQVVTAMMAGLREAVESYALAGLPAVTDWATTLRRLRTEHHGIVEAITARDATAASTRIHAHITGYYTETHPQETPPW
ncbi:FadR/GntR family transcriptional regulator [Microterricola viridarii]|uniref:GntR family transcriptional regulator n=1 Tax=Microterricola viridarii TaxID=412690 RepID=A0A0Y0NYZ7_9MICO|nr:FCD domain-containing protein [Microterricola viridarii]AMB60014.1 GntR family transcriptional regulator [Microterricola viridarii]